jgi:adenine-specific DNA-methyltransferase
VSRKNQQDGASYARPNESNNVVELRWATKSGLVDEGLIEPRLLRTKANDGALRGTASNVLVLGDASVAMTHLLAHTESHAQFAGKVALCYIDPPFNTGEDFGQYDDSMSRPEWLSMMRNTLHLARSFLSSQGSIWVHLDDSAQHHGRCLLDEVFGPDAFVATVIWQKRTSRDSRKSFSPMHDYIHVYAPAGPIAWKKRRNLLPDTGAFVNPDNDPRGPWRSIPMTSQAGHATAAQFYTVVTPTGASHSPPPGRCWTYSKKRLEELDAEGRVYWPRDGHGKPRLKRYRDEVQGVAPFTIWFADEVGDNSKAKKDLIAELGGTPAFDTPKPEGLLERIIHIGSNSDELVMDYFLGSGTTAVVAQRMGRRWLGIEKGREVLQSCTIPRLETTRLQGTDSEDEAPRFNVIDLSGVESDSSAAAAS